MRIHYHTLSSLDNINLSVGEKSVCLTKEVLVVAFFPQERKEMIFFLIKSVSGFHFHAVALSSQLLGGGHLRGTLSFQRSLAITHI